MRVNANLRVNPKTVHEGCKDCFDLIGTMGLFEFLGISEPLEPDLAIRKKMYMDLP